MSPTARTRIPSDLGIRKAPPPGTWRLRRPGFRVRFHSSLTWVGLQWHFYLLQPLNTRSCASQDSLSVARHLLHRNSFSLFARSALTSGATFRYPCHPF
ncbi:hypothetical protein BO85DRAFT_21875 [Aspergillus piperis CBS 112811]|uniref:Uncharacterized protein n=1 Tax=Aspergillus piperis CBS 112811 TaxID=1448313 RepID=A0A8G1VSV6_9EURO|nr:hypothetical protein BO85DRAFT_21875 [Aspergillus piperis CBS 112811]RAH63350.1 hypothetical protein BO85DRAFT_21875 [Aspergillus piperis CBS 112811]